VKENQFVSIEMEKTMKSEIKKCMMFANASAFVCITTMGKINH